ncbi:peptide-methionine (R)-S-oxide reductase [Hahella sp. CCB-MM4]|uniref:peptide-methionine (R)-S-oxide reductase MsrB n=1 Tax=Hahella sp. (strain CCB-MM4) TaxID=1926491 RepID=UPI000B9A1D92|nr:peptide-methionine (R)-S-oxide reductase MsrB [Hahella sp. CCB-MM4]OZG73910.1 peptide-methionine (R)-S-oxide reductase [Hahella sp. CCB-MM4]
MDRRIFIGGAISTVVALSLGRNGSAATAPQNTGSGDFPPIQKAKTEWKELLTRQQYDVLFEEATERPWSSPLNKEKREGTYVCAACFLPLFSSDAKFDSGTGWPSFFRPIAGHTGTSRDWKLLIPRTEYHCARCGGHQGHVFNDGPKPTGQRWCNNGVALRFVPASETLPELRS